MAVKKLDIFRGVLLFTAFLSCLGPVYAQKNQPQVAHLLPVGQGISSPTFHTGLVYQSSYAAQNPVGLIYEQGFYATAFRDSGNTGSEDREGKGAAITWGNGKWGFGGAVREYDYACCDGRDFNGGVAFTIRDNLSVGYKHQYGKNVGGLIFNPYGKYRIGFVAEDLGNDIDFGGGLSVVEEGYTFSLDYVQKDDGDAELTGGLMIRMTVAQFSINYETDISGESDNDEDIWWGIGLFVFKDAYLSYRSDFFNDNQFVFTYAS